MKRGNSYVVLKQMDEFVFSFLQYFPKNDSVKI